MSAEGVGGRSGGELRLVWGGLLLACFMVLGGLYGILAVPEDIPLERPVAVDSREPADRAPRAESGSELMVPDPVHRPALVGVEHRRDIPELVNLQFIDRAGAAGAFTRLRSLLAPRTVTVVNVWATWCGPCRREFSDFRKLFEAWGDDVKFVPIQLGDDPPGELKEAMPPAEHHLVDLVSEGSIQRALGRLKLSSDAKIPITLVFDCQRRLRWLHIEEIQDFSILARKVEELRKELRTGSCAPRPAGGLNPPLTVEGTGGASVAPAFCGDGTCQKPLGEDCRRCAKDCACPQGESCVRQEKSRRHICSVSADQLMRPEIL